MLAQFVGPGGAKHSSSRLEIVNRDYIPCNVSENYVGSYATSEAVSSHILEDKTLFDTALTDASKRRVGKAA